MCGLGYLYRFKNSMQVRLIMKIALLSGANGIHTTRWANALAQNGHEVHLISAHPLEHNLSKDVRFYEISLPSYLAYFFGHLYLKKILAKIQPDILNAHYATGYGLLARLSGFRPYLLSIWGSDIYDFPNKSFVHRLLVQKNIRHADAVASTSKCMAKRLQIFAEPRELFITPFGVDENVFKPSSLVSGKDKLVIGTVKTLKPIYGVDVLIKAFARLKDKENLALEITGGGHLRGELETLVKELGIEEYVTFFGLVSHDKVQTYLNRLDIYVAMSRIESFGVAILEASACEKPVVVSDAEGPLEVTMDGETGIIVPRDDIGALCAALEKLISDEELRKEMGRSGRSHVLENYSWKRSIELMEDAYQSTVEKWRNENV
jgi:glycosyltransferase involved in cell wall biosynthesis